MTTRWIPQLLALPLLSLSAAAQWSSDATANLSLGDGPGSQVQPKVVASAGQGNWVSWFGGTGFDVRVQRQDGAGVEQFAHNGVLVSDRGFSSTQDYGLATATDGAALLAFRDDNFTGTQISAAKVTAAGELPWGPSNVQLTNTTAFVAAPVIAAAPGGGAYVAWTQDNTVRVQRLDGNGTPAWVSDTVLTPASGNFSVCDAHASGNGVILSFIKDNGFGSPRHLYAQRVDSSGGLTWAASHVKVFDGGSLQFGNFPDFEPDGSGGGLFSWYDTAGSLQCSVQHVLANGAEAFAHNGVPVSTDASQVRVSPDLSYDASSAEITVAWTELNATQSLRGVSAQRIDAGGTRLWGGSGTVLVPLGADDIGNVRTQVSGTDSFVAWTRAPSFGNDVLEGARLDQAGTIDVAPFSIASTPSGKGRVRETLTGAGDVVLVWNDDRSGTDDVIGQNVQADGSLGAQTWIDAGFALGGTSGEPSLVGSGSLAGGTPVGLDLGDALPGASATLVVGFDRIDAAFKGGTMVPQLDLVLYGFVVGGTGTLSLAATWPPGLPSGFTTYHQFWIADALGPAGFAASNALSATTP